MTSPFEWSWYTWFWIFWLSVAGVTFAVVEIQALLDPRAHDTLTETVVVWGKSHPIRGAIILGFLVWLLIHFARRI